MFINKRDRLRHRILKELMKPIRASQNLSLPEEDFCITIKEMAKGLKVSEDYIKLISAKLIRNEEIVFRKYGGEECMCGDTFITDAYTDRKYIKEAKTFALNRIKDILSIVVAFVAIASAIFTAWNAIKKEKDNRAEIKKLRIEVDTIKGRLQPRPRP